MMGQNTVAFIALLNLFNLTNASGDALYDSIKASKTKGDATSNALRKSTVEAARVDTVNSLTKSNPNFVPLTGGPVLKLSDQQLKDLQAQDEVTGNEAQDPNVKPHEIKADQINTKTGAVMNDKGGETAAASAAGSSSTGGAPSAGNDSPAPGGAGGPRAGGTVPSSPSIKVTNTDPDFVVFPGTPKKTSAKVRATPVPTYSK